MTLARSEADLLSRTIREAYSDTLATDTWTRVLDMLDGLVPFDVGGATFANVQTGRLENRITSKLDAEQLRSYHKYLGAIDMIANVALSRELSIWRPSEVIGKREWEATELHNTLLKDHRLGEPFCMICGSATEISGRFWFIREHRKSDFSERDRFVLGLLQPHFSAALSLAKEHLEADIYRDSFRRTVRPGVICDASGKIMKMNESAKRLARDGDGKDNEFLAELEAVAQDMVARGVHLLAASLGGQRCRLSISPAHSQHAPTSYLLFVDTAEYLRNVMRRLMQEYGLSEREADVCWMLVHGSSNRQVADKLFISEATAKDHVTSIFEKLGVSSRSAVVPKLFGF